VHQNHSLKSGGTPRHAGPLVSELFLVVILLVFLAGSIRAQESETEGSFEISSIDFEGNRYVGSSELLAQLVTRETPGFFNRFLYYSINDHLGRRREFFDPRTFSEDCQRLRAYYNDHGFHQARIDTSLRFSVEENELDILFVIDEGYQSIIDTVVFKGIAGVPDFVFDDMQSSPKIAQYDPFDRGLIDAEVLRVRKILWDAGYPNARFLRDSSSATYRTSTRNYIVTVAYDIGKRYLWGDIIIHNELDSIREDITPGIILQQLDYKYGDFYSSASRASSEQNLNRVGIFDQASILTTVPPNSDSSIFVTSRISVRPRDKHELAPELVFSDENNAFNLGAGIGYSSRNFFGGARTFSTRLRFRTQTINEFPDYFGVATDAVSNIDLTFEMLQPFVFTNKVKGNWAFSLIRDKQKPYRQDIIRNRFGFTDKFANFTNGLLEWTLERVSLQRNPNFPDSSSDPETQDQINKLREQETKVQFNSILSFTIQRDITNDLFRPSEGFIHTATFQESGLLPLLLRRSQPDLPFTQFYSATLLGRWYFDLTNRRFSILALKIKAGYEDKYGESRSDDSRVIPPAYRFYAGGGGSVRGWGPRDLSATGDPLFGGNVALEGSFEVRTNILQSLHDDFLDKIWIVTFLDLGNVWGTIHDLSVGDIALAAGIGFRYDTFFGPFRVDYGFRIYNPAEPNRRQWITDRQFLGQTLKEGIIHFGIGHAF
jgi:outer membrane protein assembly factor BamA